MKVLIKKCSKDYYWYNGGIGTGVGILSVDHGLERYDVGGGLWVDFSDAELLYTEEEYNQLKETHANLKRHSDYQKTVIERDTDKIIEMEEKIKEAKQIMKDNLEAISEIRIMSEPVSIPQEVAHAIESVWDRAHHANLAKHNVFTDWISLKGFHSGEYHSLRGYFLSHPMKYMSALVNGYTIERDEKEEKTVNKVLDIVTDYASDHMDGLSYVDKKKLKDALWKLFQESEGK